MKAYHDFVEARIAARKAGYNMLSPRSRKSRRAAGSVHAGTSNAGLSPEFEKPTWQAIVEGLRSPEELPGEMAFFAADAIEHLLTTGHLPETLRVLLRPRSKVSPPDVVYDQRIAAWYVDAAEKGRIQCDQGEAIDAVSKRFCVSVSTVKAWQIEHGSSDQFHPEFLEQDPESLAENSIMRFKQKDPELPTDSLSPGQLWVQRLCLYFEQSAHHYKAFGQGKQARI